METYANEKRILHISMINYIYKNTVPNSPFRCWMVHQVVFDLNIDATRGVPGQYNEEMLLDTAIGKKVRNMLDYEVPEDS